nr:hypothetical protein [Tanacetum cinerariifolium]
MDEALVPTAQRLRIGRSNFRLLLDIKSKESTLQLVYDVLRRCPFFKAFLITADVPEIYMDILHICPRVHGQSFAEPPFEEEILAFIHFLGHIVSIRTLTDVPQDYDAIFRYAMFIYSFYLCYVLSLYPFTERYAQPYFFSCLIRQCPDYGRSNLEQFENGRTF